MSQFALKTHARARATHKISTKFLFSSFHWDQLFISPVYQLQILSLLSILVFLSVKLYWTSSLRVEQHNKRQIQRARESLMRTTALARDSDTFIKLTYVLCRCILVIANTLFMYNMYKLCKPSFIVVKCTFRFVTFICFSFFFLFVHIYIYTKLLLLISAGEREREREKVWERETEYKRVSMMKYISIRKIYVCVCVCVYRKFVIFRVCARSISPSPLTWSRQRLCVCFSLENVTIARIGARLLLDNNIYIYIRIFNINAQQHCIVSFFSCIDVYVGREETHFPLLNHRTRIGGLSSTDNR